MRCPRCDWPADEMTTLSTHRTSEGWVAYRRCVCGALSVGPLTAHADLAHADLARPRTAPEPAAQPAAHRAAAGLLG